MSEGLQAFRRDAWRQVDRASRELTHAHLKGVLEAVLFAARNPLSLRELCRAARSPRAAVAQVLETLVEEYENRGIQLDNVAGGCIFRTNPRFAPFVRGVAGK